MSRIDLTGKHLLKSKKRGFFVDTENILEDDIVIDRRNAVQKIFNPVDNYIILSPSLYWIKKEKITVKSLKKAKRLAPAIFNGALPFGEYDYAAFNGADGEIVFVAYDKAAITEKLRSFDRLNLKARNTKFFLAQTEFADLGHDTALGHEYALSCVDGVVVKLPLSYGDTRPIRWHEATKLLTPTCNNISLTEGAKAEFRLPKVDIAPSILAILLVVCAFLYGVESFKSYKELKGISDEKELIAAQYGIPLDRATMEVERKKYEAIEKKQLSVRKELKIFNSLPLTTGESVEKISYDNGRLALSIKSSRGAELKSYFESNAKLEGFASSGDTIECRVVAE